MDPDFSQVADEQQPELEARDRNDECSINKIPGEDGDIGCRFQMDHDGLCMRPPPDVCCLYL